MIGKRIQPPSKSKSPKKKFTDDELRWQAVVRRDPAADDTFYYAVRTTGVYCRPSCAARPPNRKNVRFFATREKAARAGFRPCKRCRPNANSLANRHQHVVTRACRLIENAVHPPKLTDLAHAAGMSRFHFHRVFKSMAGVTPKAYAAAHRSRRLRTELDSGDTVTNAIYGAGFASSGRFYASSTEQLGMTPSAFLAGGQGTTIRFAVGECSLGSILVAASDKGVCSILLGDDPHALARDLQDRFPKAQLIGADAAFDNWVAQAVGLVEQPALGLDLPLDIRGTAFQRRVWEQLRRIPPGSTASYSEIARRLGHPKATRAVARACAANPLAVAIPCHRAIRTDGSISGYRWGIERKAELLKLEQPAG